MKIKNNMKLPHHLAIILDGNGRWAKRRGLPRNVGHYFGAMNLVEISKHANALGIGMLSVYAFSTENWKRPVDEVNYLMTKPIDLLASNLTKMGESNIIIKFVGRKNIPADLKTVFLEVEKTTSKNTGMILNICFDYGSYDEILMAINSIPRDQEITKEMLEEHLYIKEPVDFLIRTSGEQRISNFLLWQISYAELYFTKVHFPAFNKRRLNKALMVYNKRQRRFGGLQ